MWVQFRGHTEAQGCSFGFGFFFDAFDGCCRAEQLQGGCHALVEGVGFDPDVDVGDD